MANPIVDAPKTVYGVPLPMYSARDNAITQRPPSSALLCIDSEDRFKDYTVSRTSTSSNPLNNTPYDFTIRKNESLMNGFFTRLAVTEVVFPWVIPNVNTRTQDITFALYNITGAPVLVRRSGLTLVQGFYTPAELAAALQDNIRALNPEIPAFEMVYGSDPIPPVPQGGECAFYWNTANANYALCFEPMTPNTAQYPYGPQVKQLFDVLGLDNSNTVPGGFTDAGGYTLCQAIRYIDIVCTQLVNNQALKDTMSQAIARDVLCRLYINSPTDQSTVQPTSATFSPPGCAPTVIYRNFATPKQIQWMPNQPVPGYLRFQVYDDNGEELVSADASGNANRTNWSMTLQVTEN